MNSVRNPFHAHTTVATEPTPGEVLLLEDPQLGESVERWEGDREAEKYANLPLLPSGNRMGPDGFLQDEQKVLIK